MFGSRENRREVGVLWLKKIRKKKISQNQKEHRKVNKKEKREGAQRNKTACNHQTRVVAKNC
jgi:hypothetical protein